MEIVLLTNILSPYRKVFFDLLHREFEGQGIGFTVLVMADTEPNRIWRYHEYSAEYTKLLTGKTINIQGIYFHVNYNLRHVLHDISPDIVICAGSYTLPSVWQAMWLKKKLKYRTVFWSESHLDEVRGPNNARTHVREAVRSFIYPKFDGFWYAGKKSLELIHKYCGIGKKFWFAPNLVDNTFFSMAADTQSCVRNDYCVENNIDKEQFIFICPARLTTVKGILPFIDVMSLVAQKPHITILIAGDGELRDDIMTRAALAQIDIRLLGQQTPEDMLVLYGIADAFLMPSLSDPNPLTCIEAAWAGLPLLVSEHVGNHPELVHQGENGYVFSYQDTLVAAQLVSEIVSSTVEWRQNAGIISQGIADKLYNSTKAVKRIVGEMSQYLHVSED